MEVTIYKSLELRNARKWLYRCNVLVRDTFDMDKFECVFRSIYGSDIIIEYLSV